MFYNNKNKLWNTYTNLLNKYPLRTKVFMSCFIFFTSDCATQALLLYNDRTNDNNNNHQSSSSLPINKNNVMIDQYNNNNNSSIKDGNNSYINNVNNNISNIDHDHQTSSSLPVLFDMLQQWDIVRSISASTFGMIGTIWLHYWWGYLEIFMNKHIPIQKYKLINTLVKVVIDQSFAAPLYIYTFYTLTNTIQRLYSLYPTTSLHEILYQVHNKALYMLLPTMYQHWKLWPIVHTLNFYYIPLPHRVLIQNTILIGWSGYLSYLNSSNSPLNRRMTKRISIEHQEEE